MTTVRLFVLLFVFAAVSVESNNTSQAIKNRGKKVADGIKNKRERFREWLKWDAECDFLRPDEREIRVAKGRCPPIPTTTAPAVTSSTKESFWSRRRRQKGLPRSSVFSHGSKKKFVTAITMGQQSVDEFDISSSHDSLRLIAGTMLVLTCDKEARKDNQSLGSVRWFVNTNLVEPGLLDWRVIVGEKGELSIWPLNLTDSGTFECSVDGLHQASAIIDVITKKEALLEGVVNYFLVALFYVPLAAFAVFVVSRSASRVPKGKEREDRMSQFLEQHVMNNANGAKDNVAKLVYGKDFARKKTEIEKSSRTGVKPNGDPVRGNRDTIMTILVPPEVVPTKISSRKSVKQGAKNAVK